MNGKHQSPADHLHERYWGDGPAILSNDILRVLLSHRSVRAFSQNELPAALLETIVAAAQSASSASNLQAWSVVAVMDKERKLRLAELAGSQAAIRDASMFLVWLVDLARIRSFAGESGSNSEGLDYLESFILGIVDTSLAAQNAMVALESFGVGGVYIGAIRDNPMAVAAELDLPPSVFALFGMAIGWPEANQGIGIKPRLPQAAVLFREQYSWGARQAAAVGRYNKILREFQSSQAMKVQDWTTQASERTATVEALRGRHVLKGVLRSMGFGLR